MRKGIEIDIKEKAKEFLAERGFDQNLGARPLKRVIQKQVLDPLSLRIVSGEIKEGERVAVDFENEKIIFRTARELFSRQLKREKVAV